MRNDVAYFLTLSISKDSDLGKNPAELEKMIQHVKDVVEEKPLCYYSSKEEESNDISICFDCDQSGGIVKGLDDDELLALLCPLSANYPTVYFNLYCDDTDDKTNKTYILKNGKYRVDTSIQIDSMLSLEPLESRPYVIDCNLDDLDRCKVEELLHFIGRDYSIHEKPSTLVTATTQPS